MVAGIAALAVGSIAGCAEGQPEALPFTTSDSAGVQISTSSTPLHAAGSWSVAGDPEVVIGARDGDGYTLFGVQGATVLSDGQIVVAQRGEPIVRWFDADGTYLVGVGRMGQGPGEFDRSLADLWPLTADSVGTWEFSLRRMHIFDPDGAFTRSVTIELPPESEPGEHPVGIGWSTGGMSAYVLPPEREVVRGVVTRPSWAFHAYGPDGSHLREIAQLPGQEYIGIESSRTGLLVPSGPPFTNTAWSAVHDGHLYYAPGESLSVDVWGLDGTLRQRVRAVFDPIDVTGEIEDEYFRVRAEGSPRSPAEVRASFEGRPFPEQIPAINRIKVDRGGSIWLRQYPLPADTLATWTVFSPEGRWLTDLEMPVAWTIHDIGDDYVLAMVRDDLDVEQVVRFRLNRGG